jgi:hypothetical protein
MRRGALAVLIVTALVTRSAWADDAKDARDAFERGNDAHERGDFAAAALAYAKADELAKNDASLSAALEEATLAGDAVLAMKLVQRAEGRAGAAAAASRAREKFKDAVGYLEGDFGTIDGAAVQGKAPYVVAVGHHEVAGTSFPHGPAQPGKAWSNAVDVQPGKTHTLRAPAERVVPAPPPPDATPFSPWWAVGTGALALGAGVGTLASYLGARSQHDAFVSAGCQVRYDPSCDAQASSGQAADVRTGILLGVTLAAAVTTVVLTIVTVKSHAPPATGFLPGGLRVLF